MKDKDKDKDKKKQIKEIKKEIKNVLLLKEKRIENWKFKRKFKIIFQKVY